jgi:tetratricopeptide (TPR) repeat protein
MTLVAQALTAPQTPSAAAPGVGARAFAELDERVASGAPGVVLVRAPSREAAHSAGAHVARRLTASGLLPLEARKRAGAPLWREVASLLGVASVPSEPGKCAEEIAQAAALRRAAIVAPLPAAGSWDRAVAAEIAALANAPLVVFVGDSAEAAAELRAEAFEIGATLDAGERGRWWAAIAEGAHAQVATDDLAALDAWWSNAQKAPAVRARADAMTPLAGESLLVSLALAARAWPASDLAVLGADAEALEALRRASAVRVMGGWIAIEPAWEARAEQAAAAAPGGVLEMVAAALEARWPVEPWAYARAAELLARAGVFDAADRAHASAVARAEDALARRELVARWMDVVVDVRQEHQLPLRVRAAERALAVGEAEEAYRWAQSAAAIAPEDASVTMLFGRAAVAIGDLVAAKVALERGQNAAPGAAGLIAAELAEVAYLSGDLALAARQAERALDRAPDAATRLKARNTLGKILLAESRWDDADHHFAEDAWVAASCGERTAELRARLNRGIALLSKGLTDEARSIFDGVLAEGERIGDARACAFALDNLSVVAMLRHDYGGALSLTERTLKLRQRVGDRLAMTVVLANLGELRRKLGLLDHAEHAVAFGRRTLGPGMPPACAAHY